MKKLYLFICPVFFYLNLSAQTGISIPQMSGCDSQVESFLSTYNIPGATIAIAKDGKLIYMRGFGYSDLAHTDSVQPYNLFRIASVSKPITSIAIMTMIQNGDISIDDTVFGPHGLLANHSYLSTANITDNRIYNITIRELLEHTAGWNRDLNCITGNATPYTYSPTSCDPIGWPLHVTYTLGEPNPVKEEMHIKFLLEKGLDFNPGTQYHYSNIGYLVLGEVIKEVSGMSYEDYVRTHVLEPAGVCDMHLGKSHLADKMEREGEYEGNGYTSLSAWGTGQNVPWEYGGWVLEAMSAHGGWIATARDLVRVILAVDGFTTKPDILNTSTRNLMVTPSAVGSGYAKGWQVNSFGNWWHTGSLDGTASIIARTSGGYAWAVILNKRNLTNSNNFYAALDNLPWNCISGLSNVPSVDFLASPTTPPQNLGHATNGTNGDITVTWNNGNGDKRLVVVSGINAEPSFPRDGKNYSANATYGQGADLGNGNFVVYDGTQSSVTIQGLNQDSAYTVRVYEYNQNAITGQYALYNLCGRAEENIYPFGFGLQENLELAKLSPNPVHNFLNVKMNEPVEGKAIVVNAAGSPVFKHKVSGDQFRWDLSNLPTGFYILHLNTGKGVSYYKFLKN